jgi:DNA polymerase-3 subunit epsilon/CBS domain-containing protein
MASTTPVAEAPLFVDVWPGFNGFWVAVVIGHTVGFDLAVLKRECDLAGLPWTPTPLDTRLLAHRRTGTGRLYAGTLAAWLG